MELIRRPLHRHTQGDQPPPPTPIHFIGEDVEKNSHVKRTSLQSSQWIIRVLYLMGFMVSVLYPLFPYLLFPVPTSYPLFSIAILAISVIP